MSFQIVYVGGGMLDKVRSVTRLESGRLDSPYMPTLTEPFIKGRRLEIPGKVTTVTDTFQLSFPVELLSIAIGANKYQSKDYWNLAVDGSIIIETIYTKQLPEGINLTVVKPIPANTPITFSFANQGGAPKTVWYNLQFLKGAGA